MIFQRNVKLSALLFAIVFAMSITWSNFAFALNEAPRTFTLDGRIFNSPTSSTPLLGAVTINVKILDPSGVCVLYEEAQPFNTTATNGYFNVPVGSVTGAVKRVGDDPNHTMETIYQNTALISAVNAGCGGGYTPSAGDARLVRVTVTPIATGIAQVFSPDMRLDAVPTAVVAESIQGLSRDNMLELNTNVELTQANIENVFSVANYPVLTSLLAGTSSLYMKASPSAAVSFNGQQITNVAAPTLGTDATNKTYVDSNIGGKAADTVTFAGIAAGDAGKVMVWDGTKWTAAAPSGDATKLPLAGGTMTGAINMGSQNLLATGHITMSTQTTLNLGTYTNAQETVLVLGLGAPDAGKFWYNTDVPGLKVWNGTTAVAAVQGGTSAGGDLTGTYPNPSVAANAIVASKINDGAVTSAKILDATILGSDIASSTITDTNIAGVGAGKITSGAGVYFTYAPNNTPCTDGQYMRWDNTNTRWVCGTPTDNGITALTGDVTASGNGSVAATISNNAVTNTKLAALAVTDAKVNDVSVSKISSGPGQYFSYMPGNTACADGQVLSWDNTNSRWICAAATAGSVTSIATGTGLTGGPINSVGTISIAPGGVSATELATDAVTSTKILDGTIATIDIADNAITDAKINSGAVTTPKLFANPGANYLVMTDGVAGSTLVSKSCAIGEILKWTITGWACLPDDTSGGTVTGIATGTGLTGGPITGTGTIELSSSIVNGLWSVNGSDIYRSGGNVGIGTTSPTLPLEVVGSIKGTALIGPLSPGTSGNIGSRFGVGGAGPPGIVGIQGENYLNTPVLSINDNAMGVGSGILLIARSYNQDRFIIKDDGNVGIGTSAPNSLLTIAGVTALGETTAPTNTAGYGKLYVKSSDSKLYFMDDSGLEKNISDSAAGGTVTGVATGTGLTGGPIGTTGTISLATSVINGLWSGDGTNVYRSTGGVGIGTTAPVEKLDVAGRLALQSLGASIDSSPMILETDTDIANATTTALYIYPRDSASHRVFFGKPTREIYAVDFSNSNGLANVKSISGHGGGATLTLDGASTSDAVYGTGGVQAYPSVDSSRPAIFANSRVVDGPTAVGLVLKTVNSLSNASARLFALDNGATNTVTVMASGNTGIGTSVPNSLLTVAGVTALGETTAPALTAGFGKLYVKSADSKLYFMDDAGVEKNISDGASGGTVTGIATGTGLSGGPITGSGTISLDSSVLNGLWSGNGTHVYRNSGNVGIGTTSPAQALDVSGNVNLTGDISFASKAVIDNTASDVRIIPTVPFFITNSGNTATILSVDPTNSRLGVNIQTPTLPFQVHGATDSDLVVNTSGNVGIGTTTPSSRLFVTTNDSDDNLVTAKFSADLNSNVNNTEWIDRSGLTSAWIGGNGSFTSNISNSIRGNAGGAGDWASLNFYETGSSTNLAKIAANRLAGGSTDGELVFSTSSGGAAATERMRIGSTGNVAIGTTSPNILNKVDIKQTVTNSVAATTSNAMMADVTLNPSGSQATNTYNRGLTGAVYAPGSVSQNLGVIRGVDGFAESSSTGNIHDLTAIYGWAGSYSTASVTNIRGVMGYAEVDGGTTTNIKGIESNLQINGGTISNQYGVFIKLENFGGSTTNRYGMYINSPTGSAANDYGIFQSGVSSKNFFEGSLGVGTTVPNSLLTVAGVTALGETTAPTATAGFGKLYVKSADSKLYFMDDAGVEKNISDSAAGGTVTGIATGTGLTGGPITGAGTISLDTSVTNGLWTGDGTNVYRANGYVGIGTTSPDTRFHVKGGGGGVPMAKITSVASHGYIEIDAPADSQSGLVLSSGGTSKWQFIRRTPTDDLNIAGGVDTLFLKQSNGNIGIGTTAPAAKLTVQGTSDQTQLAIRQNAIQTTFPFEIQNSAGTATAWYDPVDKRHFADGGFFIANLGYAGMNVAGNNLQFWALGGPVGMVLENSGEVGIGDTAPNSLLTVAGVTALGETTAPTATAGYGKLYVKSADSKLYFMDDAGVESDLTAAAAGGVWSTNGTDVWRASGNVGIGTTAPAEELSVIGDIRLTGMISSAAVSGGFGQYSSNVFAIYNTSSAFPQLGLSPHSVQLGGATGVLAWNDKTFLNDSGVVVDTGLSRGAAGKIYVGNGTQGNYSGTLVATNIGVGTTSPTTSLNVVGDVLQQSGTNSTAAWRVQNAAGQIMAAIDTTNRNFLAGGGYGAAVMSVSQANGKTIFYNNGVVGWTSAGSADASAADVGFSRAAANKLYLGNGTLGDFSGTLVAGNVGIGTTAPADSLEVWNGGNVRLGNTNNDMRIDAKRSDNVTMWQLASDSSGSSSLKTYGSLELSANIWGNQTHSPAYSTFIYGGTSGDVYLGRSLLGGQSNDIYFGSGTNGVWNRNGDVGIGTTVPNSLLTIAGVTSLAETTAPTATANYGKIYVKSADSKLYFMNDSGVETDLLAGGGGSGTVTGIEAGTGLTGGTITSTGTLSIASNAITNALLNDAAVTSSKINDGAVTSAGILDSAIVAADLNSTITDGLWTPASGNVYRSSGFVGVGTTQPLDAVHIHAAASKDGLRITDNGTGIGLSLQGYYPSINFNQYYDGANNRYIGTGYAGYINMDPGVGDLRFGLNGNGVAGAVVGSTVPMLVKANGKIYMNGNTGIGIANPASRLQLSAAVSAASWTTTGAMLSVDANTITDTTGSGTIATRAVSSFGTPTLASTNPVTLTNAATMYIAGAPAAGANTTITNSRALHVNSGNAYFGGNAQVVGNLGVGTTNPAHALDVVGDGIYLNGVDILANGPSNAVTYSAGSYPFSFNNTMAFNLTRFMGAANTAMAATDAAAYVVPKSGSINNLYVAANANTLTLATTTVTLMKNGVATGLTTTLAAGATSGNDTVNSVSVSAGDSISMRIVTSNAGAGNIDRPRASVNFDTTTNVFSSQWANNSSDIGFATGNVGVGTTIPVSLLTVEGIAALRETTAPTATANYGKLYVKSSDSKLYFMDDAGVETDLLAGGGGGVSGIATGTGLTGGPITSAGTLSIASNAITASLLNDDAVTSAKILDGAIVAADLNSSVTDGLWSAAGGNVYRSAGNVGIGTTSPSSPIDVNGNATVRGGILMPGAGSATTAISADLGGAGTGLLIFTTNGSAGSIGLYDNGVKLNNTGIFSWSATGSANSTADTSISRGAANKVLVGNGTGGDYTGTLVAGAIGIGTTAPAAALDVNGQIRSAVYNAGSSTTIDWNNGNVQYTSAACDGTGNQFTFSNMLEGGSYSLIVTGTATGSCNFTCNSNSCTAGAYTSVTPSGVTAWTYRPANGTPTGTYTVYTMIRAGGKVFVSWITGFDAGT